MKRISKVFSVIALCALMLFMTACGSGSKEKFKHGTVSGSTYTSDFIGVKATFGSGWTFYTEAQLAQANGVSDMSASSIESAFSKTGTINEMMVLKEDGTSVNIVVQDCTKTGKLKEDTYFTSVGLDMIKTQLESMGAKASLSAGTVTFLGKSARCINASMTMNGVTVYMIQVPIFKDDYIASITFGSVNKSDLPSLVAMFTAA